MKQCNKCNEFSPLSNFQADKRNADGKQGICSACKNKDKQERRASRISAKDYVVPVSKNCNKCGNLKTIDLFFNDKAMRDGKSSICKECKKEDVYRWREENKDKYNADMSAYQKANPEARYGYEIKRRYGCDLVQYNAMLVAQGGKCAICPALHNPADKRGRLFVDHCHTTTGIRELLCRHCNSMLGYAKDNVETLKSAIAYLNKHNK